MATKILGLCGSLRKGSYNRMTLDAARALAPDLATGGVEIESFDHLGDVPPYNEDVREKGFPPVIETLREQVRAADALLFVTPEYNYSVPGVLKNAVDWVSRPPDQPFKGKPCAVMGASISILGSARAQYHLRQSMVFLDMHPVNQPEVMIATAKEKFDADGKLKDETAKKLIRQLLENLVAWTKRLG